MWVKFLFYTEIVTVNIYNFFFPHKQQRTTIILAY